MNTTLDPRPTTQNSKLKTQDSPRTGIVRTFNENKGYGFITTDEPVPGARFENEIFVHYLDVLGKKYLEPGERVEFEIVEGYNGRPRAAKVLVVETFRRDVPDQSTGPAAKPSTSN